MSLACPVCYKVFHSYHDESAMTTLERHISREHDGSTSREIGVREDLVERLLTVAEDGYRTTRDDDLVAKALHRAHDRFQREVVADE